MLPEKHPFILEINTWTWLSEMSKKYRQTISLQNVPADEWNSIALDGFQYVWLMGVWKRSAEGLRIALEHQGIINECREVLEDFRPADMVGSPYCIREYRVDEMLGGESGLAAARFELKERGIGLILDFVPNHVAPDHPWTESDPDFFIQGTADDLARHPYHYYPSARHIFALAHDPFYPPWPDVLQLNVFSDDLRAGTTETLLRIAHLCDGVRCDMAMLVVNRIFRQTWGDQTGAMPEEDFWNTIIPRIKSAYPGFLFIAEVYWDMEWELLQQGFDYCYDKRLYDRLINDTAHSIRMHLQADLSFQERLVRFIENHDEKRASFLLEEPKHKAAMLAMTTLPGAVLIHRGQSEGKKQKIPVFLTRQPEEDPNEALKEFYSRVQAVLGDPVFHQGTWELLSSTGWPGNYSCHQLLAWSWTFNSQRVIVVINYSGEPAQGMVRWPWQEPPDQQIQLNDVLQQVSYLRSTNDLNEFGLYIDLGPWCAHLMLL